MRSDRVRSVLYLPASNARAIEKARTLDCDVAVLDLEDFLVSNIWLPLGSIIYLLFCTSRYGWGWKNFKEEANEGGGFKVRDGIRVYVSYILPLIVLVIFVLGIKDKILLLFS